MNSLIYKEVNILGKFDLDDGAGVGSVDICSPTFSSLPIEILSMIIEILIYRMTPEELVRCYITLMSLSRGMRVLVSHEFRLGSPMAQAIEIIVSRSAKLNDKFDPALLQFSEAVLAHARYYSLHAVPGFSLEIPGQSIANVYCQLDRAQEFLSSDLEHPFHTISMSKRISPAKYQTSNRQYTGTRIFACYIDFARKKFLPITDQLRARPNTAPGQEDILRWHTSELLNTRYWSIPIESLKRRVLESQPHLNMIQNLIYLNLRLRDKEKSRRYIELFERLLNALLASNSLTRLQLSHVSNLNDLQALVRFLASDRCKLNTLQISFSKVELLTMLSEGEKDSVFFNPNVNVRIKFNESNAASSDTVLQIFSKIISTPGNQLTKLDLGSYLDEVTDESAQRFFGSLGSDACQIRSLSICSLGRHIISEQNRHFTRALRTLSISAFHPENLGSLVSILTSPGNQVSRVYIDMNRALYTTRAERRTFNDNYRQLLSALNSQNCLVDEVVFDISINYFLGPIADDILTRLRGGLAPQVKLAMNEVLNNFDRIPDQPRVTPSKIQGRVLAEEYYCRGIDRRVQSSAWIDNEYGNLYSSTLNRIANERLVFLIGHFYPSWIKRQFSGLRKIFFRFFVFPILAPVVLTIYFAVHIRQHPKSLPLYIIAFLLYMSLMYIVYFSQPSYYIIIGTIILSPILVCLLPLALMYVWEPHFMFNDLSKGKVLGLLWIYLLTSVSVTIKLSHFSIMISLGLSLALLYSLLVMVSFFKSTAYLTNPSEGDDLSVTLHQRYFDKYGNRNWDVNPDASYNDKNLAVERLWCIAAAFNAAVMNLDNPTVPLTMKFSSTLTMIAALEAFMDGRFRIEGPDDICNGIRDLANEIKQNESAHKPRICMQLPFFRQGAIQNIGEDEPVKPLTFNSTKGLHQNRLDELKIADCEMGYDSASHMSTICIL